MKEVTIFQENIEPIKFIDNNDDSSIDEYSNDLSKLLKYNKISIISTDKESAIIRPSKIISISVREIELKQFTEAKSVGKEPSEEYIISEDDKDVIMDAE